MSWSSTPLLNDTASTYHQGYYYYGNPTQEPSASPGVFLIPRSSQMPNDPYASSSLHPAPPPSLHHHSTNQQPVLLQHAPLSVQPSPVEQPPLSTRSSTAPDDATRPLFEHMLEHPTHLEGLSFLLLCLADKPNGRAPSYKRDPSLFLDRFHLLCQRAQDPEISHLFRQLTQRTSALAPQNTSPVTEIHEPREVKGSGPNGISGQTQSNMDRRALIERFSENIFNLEDDEVATMARRFSPYRGNIARVLARDWEPYKRRLAKEGIPKTPMGPPRTQPQSQAQPRPRMPERQPTQNEAPRSNTLGYQSSPGAPPVFQQLRIPKPQYPVNWT